MDRFKATAPGRIRAWIVPLPHVEFAVSHACGVVKHDAFQNTPEPFERVQQRLARAFCILLPRTGLAIIGFRTNQSVPHETIQNIGGNPKIVKVRAKACLLLSIFSTYSARMIKAGNQRGNSGFRPEHSPEERHIISSMVVFVSVSCVVFGFPIIHESLLDGIPIASALSGVLEHRGTELVLPLI